MNISSYELIKNVTDVIGYGLAGCAHLAGECIRPRGTWGLSVIET